MATTKSFFIFVHIFQWIFFSDKYINALKVKRLGLVTICLGGNLGTVRNKSEQHKVKG